jgi:GNAT superfamily N-acetyltransferase
LSTSSATTLSALEAYYDAVPRPACRVEQIGPFTLFINRGPGWPYYARPSLGTRRFAAADVQRVRARQQEQERLQSGQTVTAVALVERAPVGIGSHQPVGPVTEIVGLGVLPAFRRRGMAAALTCRLMDDALERGVQTVFLSAGDDTIGRIYERLGFRRIGTALIAVPMQAPLAADTAGSQ